MRPAAGSDATLPLAGVRTAPQRRPGSAKQPAVVLPVARVVVDSPLPHLDRPFDYLVPDTLDETVQAGSRVRVRFAGRLIDAWVLERVEASEHHGRLSYLERGAGDLPVLTPETAALFRAVADRWAGTMSDVIRLGVPARHARAEAAVLAKAADRPGPAPVAPPDPAGWARYRAGASYLTALTDGRAARAVWNILPSDDWPTRIAEAVAATAAGGRGSIVVVPDAADAARVSAALDRALPPDRHVLLQADVGPESRYRRWLTVRTGVATVAVGPRSTVFAPVADLGLIVVFDDGDDLHAEPRAPYPHARDVAVLRAAMTGAAVLLAGYARTAEGAQLVSGGWAHEIVADRAVVRSAAPRVLPVGDDFELARDPGARSARLPDLAMRTARQALSAGRPVLVQVPRRGYLPALACARDRSPARCPHCSGPLAASGGRGVPSCRWCGRPAAGWKCPVCSGTALRAVTVGSVRTAEEIGRALAGVPIRNSNGESRLTTVPDGPSVVVATPGAEPVVADGYGAALLLDGWSMLARPDLRAAEETLRRWFNAAALVRPDGTVVVGADAALVPVQALVRWDPAGFAERELADRAELGFPPVTRLASVTGAAPDVADLLAQSRLPDSCEELGVAVVDDPRRRYETEQVRALLRVPRADGGRLAESLHAGAAVRSARKSPGAVRIELDPAALE